MQSLLEKQELSGNFQCSSLQQLTSESVTEDLNNLLTILGDNVWMHLDIMAFFDEATNQSALTRLHLAFLTKQVRTSCPQCIFCIFFFIHFTLF